MPKRKTKRKPSITAAQLPAELDVSELSGDEARSLCRLLLSQLQLPSLAELRARLRRAKRP